MVLEMLVTVSHFVATTPVILVICLGTTFFLVGIIAVTMFFYQRKTSLSSIRRKGGVFLADQSPEQEIEIGLETALISAQQRQQQQQRQNRKVSRLIFAKRNSKFRFEFLGHKDIALVQIRPPCFLELGGRRKSRNSPSSLKKQNSIETLTKV